MVLRRGTAPTDDPHRHPTGGSAPASRRSPCVIAALDTPTARASSALLPYTLSSSSRCHSRQRSGPLRRRDRRRRRQAGTGSTKTKTHIY